MGREEAGRDQWKTARDKARRCARYRLQNRVATTGCQQDDSSPTVNSSEMPGLSANFSHFDPHEVLARILDGDRSYFSLRFLETNFDQLNQPFSSEYWWQTNTTEEPPLRRLLLRQEKIESWFGAEGCECLRQKIEARDTCTWIQAAVWIQRYYILSALLKAGISPFREEGELSRLITRRFVLDVPGSLASYIVTKIYRAREESKDIRGTCPFCNSTDSSVLLRIPTVCTDHRFCETCLWRNIYSNLDTRVGDILQCPVCSEETPPPSFLKDQDPESRRLESLRKYHELGSLGAPISSKSKGRKKCLEKEYICSSWDLALQDSVGKTQEQRINRFFLNIENNSLQYVRICLEQGIDVNASNEYGQTGFFIAVWRRDLQMARLLLQYGSNADLPENGGLTARELIKIRGDLDFVAFTNIWNCNDTKSIGTTTSSPIYLPEQNCALHAEPCQHGSGSFVIDNTLSDEAIHNLLGLHACLPEEKPGLQKGRPCSVRRYFCDSLGVLSSAIRTAIASSMPTLDLVTVFPQMRFLEYKEQGAFLAPHVDLDRVHPHTGKRSSHTFLLYLTDCEFGGETLLLQSTKSRPNNVVRKISPKKSRLLIFPHQCPHQGAEVESTPKLLIRGELLLE